jgi:hypothetical protein
MDKKMPKVEKTKHNQVIPNPTTGGEKKSKGFHTMPDGSTMADSAHPAGGGKGKY